MTPDILQLLAEYREAGGYMVNFTFLADGGVQVSVQNKDRHSWSCGMGEDIETAVEKAFKKPKHRTTDIIPPMVDRTLADDEDDEDDEFANLI